MAQQGNTSALKSQQCSMNWPFPLPGVSVQVSTRLASPDWVPAERPSREKNPGKKLVCV